MVYFASNAIISRAGHNTARNRQRLPAVAHHQEVFARMQMVELVVRAKVGLHARPAALFVKTAAAFKSDVTIRNVTSPRGPVNAKSILSVLTLGVEQNHAIEVGAEGEDEAGAIDALRQLIESNFGEVE